MGKRGPSRPRPNHDGRLKHTDADLFAQFCDATARHAEAAAIVPRDCVLVAGYQGDGLVKNPACQLSRDYGATMARLVGRFALTPADRAQIKYGQHGHDPDPDEIASLFS
jgi:P27 family predicted phage terminase small subunit